MLLTLLSPKAKITAAGGGSGGSKRKRYVIKRGDRLFVFNSEKAALAELQAQETIEAVQVAEEVAQEQIELVAEVTQQIDLAAMKAWAELQGQLAAYNAAYKSRHFGALVALFERLQDEDDIELLLLSL